MNKGLKIALWVVGIAVVIWAIWYFTKPKKSAVATGMSTPQGGIPVTSPSGGNAAEQTTPAAGTV